MIPLRASANLLVGRDHCFFQAGIDDAQLVRRVYERRSSRDVYARTDQVVSDDLMDVAAGDPLELLRTALVRVDRPGRVSSTVVSRL